MASRNVHENKEEPGSKKTGSGAAVTLGKGMGDLVH